MENIISYYRFIDFLEHAVNMASFFFGHCRICARVRFRREGKERRKERRDGDVLREMEGTDAPGTIISPGEENGERDPWHVERSKKGERKLDICSTPCDAQLILEVTIPTGKNYRTVFNYNRKKHNSIFYITLFLSFSCVYLLTYIL